jgi:hypothetical protein
MLHGLWNYAIKATSLDESTQFYIQNMGGELLLTWAGSYS